MTGDLPAGPFGCILADPPWRFRTWSETNQAKSASRHYRLMEMDDLKALSLPAADDCVLLMWAINPMIPQALALIEAWGFKFKTVALTWAKRTPTDAAWHFGLGYWTRQNTEQLLLATRGNPKRLAAGASVPQLLIAPRREHSRKPDEQYERIEALVGGPRLEMFARNSRPGWSSWGNETSRFDVGVDTSDW